MIFNLSGGGAPTKKYKATISGTGSWNYCYVRYPSSSGTKYYTDGREFEITDGNQIYCYVGTSRGTVKVYVNGIVVADSGQDSYISYNYTVPECTSVEITLTNESNIRIVESVDSVSITTNGLHNVQGHDFANVNIPTSYELIYSTTISANTTSTSATKVTTIETGDTSIWTSNKMVYVKIRDTAGWRDGYFYGLDAFIANNIPVNSLTSTISYTWFGTGYSMNTRKFASPMFTRAANSSPSGYGVYPTYIYDDGSIDIYARYTTTSGTATQTINGTFSVDVYLLDWPGGVSPYL